jgi:hypothetical protein
VSEEPKAPEPTGPGDEKTQPSKEDEYQRQREELLEEMRQKSPYELREELDELLERPDLAWFQECCTPRIYVTFSEDSAHATVDANRVEHRRERRFGPYQSVEIIDGEMSACALPTVGDPEGGDIVLARETPDGWEVCDGMGEDGLVFQLVSFHTALSFKETFGEQAK